MESVREIAARYWQDLNHLYFRQPWPRGGQNRLLADMAQLMISFPNLVASVSRKTSRKHLHSPALAVMRLKIQNRIPRTSIVVCDALPMRAGPPLPFYAVHPLVRVPCLQPPTNNLVLAEPGVVAEDLTAHRVHHGCNQHISIPSCSPVPRDGDGNLPPVVDHMTIVNGTYMTVLRGLCDIMAGERTVLFVA